MNMKPTEGGTDVLSSGLAMHTVLEKCRGVAGKGRTLRRREEVGCRRTFERPPGARHEAVDLSSAERLRLRQSGGRLALGADAPKHEDNEQTVEELRARIRKTVD